MTRPLTSLSTFEAMNYVLDPRNGTDFDVMGYNVQSDGEDGDLDGVTIDEVASAYNRGTEFDAADFASYGPFVLLYDTDPGPPQPASIENILYLAYAIGEWQEAPAKFIDRMVILLRKYGFTGGRV